MPVPTPSLVNRSILSEGPLRGVHYCGGLTSTALSAGTITLAITSTHNQVFTGSTTGQIVDLGNATNYNIGHEWWIYNESTTAFITVNQNGGTLLATVPPKVRIKCLLVDNSTAAGVWILGVISLSTAGGVLTAMFSSTANAISNKFLDTENIATSDSLPAVAAVSANIGILTFSGQGSAPAGNIEIRVNTSVGAAALTVALVGTQTQATSVALPVQAGDQLNCKIASGASGVQKALVKLYS